MEWDKKKQKKLEPLREQEINEIKNEKENWICWIMK